VNTTTPELGKFLLALGRFGGEVAPHRTKTGGVRIRSRKLPAKADAQGKALESCIRTLLDEGYLPASEHAAYVFDERLGVGDELGVPTHRGSSAWLIAVGEAMLAEIGGGK
jgi:hypothetical protein